MKKILITGAHSYIGTSVADYLARWPEKYAVDTLSVRGEKWKQADFSGYDAVFHVAASPMRTSATSARSRRRNIMP